VSKNGDRTKLFDLNSNMNIGRITDEKLIQSFNPDIAPRLGIDEKESTL
jgi:hypothetical protein